MIACSTADGARPGYLARISAATPLTRAAEGLVPSPAMYCPPGPAPTTSTPGAATMTEEFCWENDARAPAELTAATAMTPGNEAGEREGAKALGGPLLPAEATT